MATKNEIFQEQLSRYLATDTQSKGEILTHVCAVTGMHRKAAIRKFRSLQLRDPATEERRGRHVYYTKDVDAALETVWDAANEPCGVRKRGTLSQDLVSCFVSKAKQKNHKVYSAGTELLHPSIQEYVSILKRDRMWTHGDEATGKLLAMKEHTVRRRVSGFAERKSKRRASLPRDRRS